MGSEIVNGIVAVAVIVVLFRWFSSSNKNESAPSLATILGFRPKNVTPEMIASVQSMFPDIPRENIHFDLLRTGSVEVTCNKILEHGFLNAPTPAYLRAFPPSPQTQGAVTPPPLNGTGPSKPRSAPTLISRFHLEQRLPQSTNNNDEIVVENKAAWEDTASKREESLKERKAKMVLAARQKLLAKQEKEKQPVLGSTA